MTQCSVDFRKELRKNGSGDDDAFSLERGRPRVVWEPGATRLAGNVNVCASVTIQFNKSSYLDYSYNYYS